MHAARRALQVNEKASIFYTCLPETVDTRGQKEKQTVQRVRNGASGSRGGLTSAANLARGGLRVGWLRKAPLSFLPTSGGQFRRRSAPSRRRAAQAETGPPKGNPESTQSFRRRPTKASRARPGATAQPYSCHKGTFRRKRRQLRATGGEKLVAVCR